ncbi:hypothetical protein V5799_018172 [Amblyomma americanum]|uniref:Uncharacterized protein n=1 Tax=Amblyomma americanum TaxID=6943 RepID=A0AAQ4F057_AMBAM
MLHLSAVVINMSMETASNYPRKTKRARLTTTARPTTTPCLKMDIIFCTKRILQACTPVTRISRNSI